MSVCMSAHLVFDKVIFSLDVILVFARDVAPARSTPRFAPLLAFKNTVRRVRDGVLAGWTGQVRLYAVAVLDVAALLELVVVI